MCGVCLLAYLLVFPQDPYCSWLSFSLFLLFPHAIEAMGWKQIPDDFWFYSEQEDSLYATRKVCHLSAFPFFLILLYLIQYKYRDNAFRICCPKLLQWGWAITYLEELTSENACRFPLRFGVYRSLTLTHMIIILIIFLWVQYNILSHQQCS